ncbi:MAG: NAD-dependent epimerase/dehydratase family protein [Calditrichaeota bacterium]|nr:NAD-dependent epimerase/dehydratase family protein [Calditrichota bacterium]
MRAFVTGSNGFIGSHLIEKLVEKKYAVRCLVRKTSDLRWIENLPVEFVYGDVTQSETLIPAVKDVDVVFHLGGLVRALSWDDFFRVNALGTKNLLDTCVRENVNLKRFVYVSSQAAVGPSSDGRKINENDEPAPISLYGKSKREAEKFVWEYRSNFPVTILRPPSVYGPRDDDILEIFKYINWGVKPRVGKKERRISIIYVDDLVRGIVRAAENERGANQIFFLTGEACDWAEFENKIAQAMGKKSIQVVVPEFGVNVAAFLGELAAKITRKPALLNKDKAREMKEQFWLVDGAKAEKTLGFKPEISLEKGIKRTYRWYCEQGWL